MSFYAKKHLGFSNSDGKFLAWILMFLASMEEKGCCLHEGLEGKGTPINSATQLRNCVHGALMSQTCLANIHRTASFHTCLQSGKL